MPPYKRRYVKKRYSRSRSSSKYRRPTLLKRLRTRAYANLRQGGLLAIERKFADYAKKATLITTGVGGAVVSGGASTFSPDRFGPDTFRSSLGTCTTCAPVALNVLGPGDTGSDRDGRQVINDSIHLRGIIEYTDTVDWTSLNASCCVNIALVLDTQTNGGAPNGSDVFVNVGDITANTPGRNGQCAFVNLANSKRFRILKHIRRVLQPSAISGNATVTYPSGGWAWAMDVPLKQMKTNYIKDDAVPGATSGSIGDNGIFLFAWAEVASGVKIVYSSRLRFRG